MKPASTELRVISVLVGIGMAMPSFDAFTRMLQAWPIPLLCMAVAVSAFACSCALLVYGLHNGRQGRAALAAKSIILACVLGGGATALCCWAALACSHARGMGAKNQAKQLVVNLELGRDAFPTAQDPWGGRYHRLAMDSDLILVWSEGPDGIDDFGQKQIAPMVFRFERAFDQCYGEPYESWTGFLRRAALWELATVRSCLRGDIVWESHNTAISLATD